VKHQQSELLPNAGKGRLVGCREKPVIEPGECKVTLVPGAGAL
jgi:hypothetical protein